MKNKILVAIVFAALPLIYLSLVYTDLPAQVNIRYDLHGESTKTIPRLQAYYLIGGLTLITVVVFFLMGFIHMLSPKLADPANSKRMQNIALAVVGFMVLIQCWLIYTMQEGVNNQSLKFLLISISVLFAIIGNYMPNLKQNHVAGYRIPWTMSNEDNWRKTHELAGKVWFFGSLVIIIICIFLPFLFGLIFFGISLFCMLFIPAVYSHNLHRKMESSVL